MWGVGFFLFTKVIVKDSYSQLDIKYVDSLLMNNIIRINPNFRKYKNILRLFSTLLYLQFSFVDYFSPNNLNFTHSFDSYFKIFEVSFCNLERC